MREKNIDRESSREETEKKIDRKGKEKERGRKKKDKGEKYIQERGKIVTEVDQRSLAEPSLPTNEKGEINNDTLLLLGCL